MAITLFPGDAGCLTEKNRILAYHKEFRNSEVLASILPLLWNRHGREDLAMATAIGKHRSCKNGTKPLANIGGPHSTQGANRGIVNVRRGNSQIWTHVPNEGGFAPG